MAGFIVSNSFGKFHSESKKYLMPHLVGIPQAPATAREMANRFLQVGRAFPDWVILGDWGVRWYERFYCSRHDGKNISIM